MARVAFTANLRRHVTCPPAESPGTTVAEVLGAYFALHPAVRSYVVDEHGAVRKHVTIFVDSEQLRDRSTLTDPVTERSEIHVMQALSGG